MPKLSSRKRFAMIPEAVPLFRSQVMAEKAQRLYGDVFISIPPTWHAIGYLMAAITVSSATFLMLGSYARVEVAPGVIMPDAGVAPILPLRTGVVTALPVRDGQEVRGGAVLAEIRTDEDSASGPPVAARIGRAIAQQDAELETQTQAIQAAAEAQLRQVAVQQAGARRELAQVQAQLDLQRELVASAQRDLGRADALAERGFVSRHDLDQRREALLSRRQALAQLAQSAETRRSAVAEAERSAAQIASQARANRAELAAARAQISQQAASMAGTRAYVLRAPIAGTVTALTARIGQPAIAQMPLMTLLPKGSTLRAELAVPSAAIGFVRKGQRVSLAVDAFPYQRFGTMMGTVDSVAASAITRADSTTSGTGAPAYPVTVALDRPSIAAFGRREPLVAGMTLTARIVTERQSLFAWLFEPVLAVRQR